MLELATLLSYPLRFEAWKSCITQCCSEIVLIESMMSHVWMQRLACTLSWFCTFFWLFKISSQNDR
jgi:hypothetical protein